MRFVILFFFVFVVLMGRSFSQEALVEMQDQKAHQGQVLGLFREGLRLKTSDGTVDLPWHRIVVLQSQDSVKITFGDGETVLAVPVGSEGDRVVLRSPHLGVFKILVSSLKPVPVTRAPAADEKKGPLEVKDWSGSVALNGSLTTGNSETLLAALDALAVRQWTHDRLELVLRLVYGETEGKESANSQAFRARFEHHYSEDLYTYARAEIFRDNIQDISLGLLVDLGVGWNVWKDSDKELLSLEGGIGFRHESYEDDTDPRNDGTVRGAVVYKDIFFDDVEVKSLAEILVPVNEPGAWLGRAEVLWQIPVSENWSLNNTIRLSYRNEPANDAEKMDVYFGAGLKYSF